MIIYYKDSTLNNGKVAAGIYLFNEKGEVLLQLRGKNTNMPNYWGCFGGKLDSKEKIIEGALREFKEESGYQGNIEKLKLIHINKNKDKEKFLFYSYVGFLKENIQTPMVGKVTVDGEVESDDAKYFSLDDVFSLKLHPGTLFTFKSKLKEIKQYINDCQKNI